MIRGVLTWLAVIIPATTFGLDCPEGWPVGGHIGIPPKYTGLVEESVESRPETVLLRASVAWLPATGRHRDQEVVRVDWAAGTHSQVDLWDGELAGYRAFGIREAELLDSTNLDTGHLDIGLCMPPRTDLSRGLVFAFYGADDEVTHTFVAPFGYTLIPEGYWFTTVVDEHTSELVAGTFNASIAGSVLADVETTTGVTAPRYLAESLIQQNLQPLTDLVARDHAPFFGGENARVMGNQVIVLDDQASIGLTHGVKAVWSEGADIRGSDYRIDSLENRLGPVAYQWHSQPRLAHIVDGRATIEVSASACTDGMSTISGQFVHPSPLASRWVIRETGPSGAAAGNQELLAETIQLSGSCDSGFEIEARREPGGAQTRAYVRFTDPELLVIRFTYFFRSLEPLAPDWRLGGTPSAEILKTVWNTADLSGLYGRTAYGCSAAGDSAVDSIDEIIGRVRSELSDTETQALGLSTDSPLLVDDDGDGTVCNAGELELGGGSGGYIYRIELEVSPNLGHPDLVTAG
jgi:hypothetical protein